MVWVYLIIILVLVVIVWRHYANPGVFARNTARTQLNSFRSMKRRFPDLTGEALYAKVLSSRPGYGKIEITRITDQAHQDANGPIIFRDVVRALIQHEYFKYRGHGNMLEDAQNLAGMRAIVDSIIPPNL